jgi:hypothetical protein
MVEAICILALLGLSGQQRMLRVRRVDLRKKFVVASFFVFCASGVPAIAHAEQTQQRNATLWLLDEEAVTLQGSVLTRPQQFANVILTSSFFDGRLTSIGELAYNFPASTSKETIPTQPPRLLYFGLYGSERSFGYGAAYRAVSAGFAHPFDPQETSDQEGGEIWVTRDAGTIQKKISLSQFWNNIAADPSCPRLIVTQGEMSMSVTRPAWPSFGFSYKRSLLESSQEPTDFQPQKHWSDTFGTKISYDRPIWKTTWSSYTSLLTDQVSSQRRSFLFYQTLSGIYAPTHAFTLNTSLLANQRSSERRSFLFLRTVGGTYTPTRTLTIAPVLSLEERRDPWSQARADTSSAAFSLTYKRSILAATISSAYTRTKSKRGTEAGGLATGASLEWIIGRSGPGEKTLSLHVTYHGFSGGIARAAAQLSGSLLLQIAAF